MSPSALPRSLWRISVQVSPQADEAVTEWLRRLYGDSVSSYADFQSGRTTVTVYLDSKRRWTASVHKDLRQHLHQLKASGLTIGTARISFGKIRRQDWAESWKRHFKPLKIGSKLLIRPAWNRGPRRKNQVSVKIDPGLSFGTGQHPTTAFCLAQLVARRREGTPQSFLDLGSGSGILAIAAAKLGYRPIDAFEFDPVALRSARTNSRRNKVSRQICFFDQDISRLSRRGPFRYSVICANLSADLLLKKFAAIVNRLEHPGVLVLAGVLKGEFSQLRRVFCAAGLQLLTSQGAKEWRSGAFTWRR